MGCSQLKVRTMHRRPPSDAPDAAGRLRLSRAEPDDGARSLAAAGAHALNAVIRFFKILGPGLITGASDDDPSAIGTFATAGASLGCSTLWLVLVIFPLLAAVQFICAKIGMVSGMGLAGMLRRHYARPLLILEALPEGEYGNMADVIRGYGEAREGED
jgi:hypothetical protein